MDNDDPPPNYSPPPDYPTNTIHFPEERLPRIISEEEEEGTGIPRNASWPADLEDTLCGVGSFRPRWLQGLANGRMYTAVFCLISVVQGMMFTYYIAVITTVEKRFKMPSKMSGFIMVGSDIATVTSTLFLSYYGGQGHRPHWVSFGVILSAISCFLMALPHFVYGPGEDVLTPTTDSDKGAMDNLDYSTESINNHTEPSAFMCLPSADLQQTSRRANSAGCYGDEGFIGPMAIMFSSHILSGIGMTLYYTVGVTYMDDGVKKTESPILFGITSGIRYVGPALGFLLASACLKMYVNPFSEPTIAPNDPRWIGAWWIGFIFIAILLFLTVICMLPFPRKLPKKLEGTQEERKHLPSGILQTTGSSESNTNRQRTISEFPASLKNLLRNKVLMYNNFASTCYMFGALGYFSFLPKYMEAQFQTTAVTASFISGSTQIVFIAVGLVLSGFLISRFKPSAKFLAAWNVFLGVLYVAAQFTFILVGCPGTNIHGRRMQGGTMDITTSCNQECSCESVKFSPVCSEDGKLTFYSPCHAGCRGFNETKDTKMFTNCSCILKLEHTWPVNEDVTLPTPWRHLRANMSTTPPFEDMSYQLASARDGWCEVECGDRFLIFIIVMAVVKLINSTGKIGNILVALRCVEERDKSFSLGLTTVMVAFGAFIPAPIAYGAIIDSTCLVWEHKCGETGNCWIYDSEALRVYLHLTTGIAMSLSTLFDALVRFHIKNLKLYGEAEEKTQIHIQMEDITAN